jgi:phage tail-like protein
MPPSDVAFVNYFSFELDGQPVDLVHEVSGMKWSFETVDYKAQNKKGIGVQRVMPGMCPRPAEVTFKTYAIDKKVPLWFSNAVKKGAAGKSKGVIVLYDQDTKPLGRYTLTGAWPSKLSWSSLSAGSSSAMELEVTVQVDAIDFTP